MAIQLRQRSDPAQFIERGYDLPPLRRSALYGHVKPFARSCSAVLVTTSWFWRQANIVNWS